MKTNNLYLNNKYEKHYSEYCVYLGAWYNQELRTRQIKSVLEIR